MKKTKLTALLLGVLFFLSSCSLNETANSGQNNTSDQENVSHSEGSSAESSKDLNEMGAYDGYFEGESSDLTIEHISGTENAYNLVDKTLTFSGISEESVYSISGRFNGNIIIDVGDEHGFTLELHGFSLICDTSCPIAIESGDKVTIKAKKDTKSYIYDTRGEVDLADEALFSSAIHSNVDLSLSGKGELFVVSKNNNGIHTKDDLRVKNLTLFVACSDNSLKGNDSVEIEYATTTLIASSGDCIKTKNSAINENGKQKGDVTINGGTHTLFAACDGIDSAHDTIIDGETTVLNIYTDKYSSYSKEVTAKSPTEYYIRFTSDAYTYSVKYYNSENDFLWVNASYHSSVSGGRSTYYYYSFPQNEKYSKMKFFIYSAEMEQGNEEEYLVCSEYLERNTSYDTFALTSRGNQLSYSWTNYTTKIQEGGFGGGPGGFGGGPGGPNEGNTEKGDHSTKGIKSANSITVKSGKLNIKSYDDSMHAGCDTALENGKTSLGNITIGGGDIIAYSNDDGIHADGTLAIHDGSVKVTNSYEGLEGEIVNISGGAVSINAKDDGINSTSTNDETVNISGGDLYIYCTGDGIDSNSRSDYSGIIFSGGNTVIISNSNGNSAIDTERGYAYKGGNVVALMPRGGMSSEALHCSNFSSIGYSAQATLKANEYLTVELNETTVFIKMPMSLSGMVVVLGDSSPKINTVSSLSEALDDNGVLWKHSI